MLCNARPGAHDSFTYKEGTSAPGQSKIASNGMVYELQKEGETFPIIYCQNYQRSGDDVVLVGLTLLFPDIRKLKYYYIFPIHMLN
ncbi:hypothetical protein I7I48_09235 [Histoplasma ohiense]|nr:hypothetical protein I7I48_09235 [Histoplasma ohiense (nom. inval.)]